MTATVITNDTAGQEVAEIKEEPTAELVEEQVVQNPEPPADAAGDSEETADETTETNETDVEPEPEAKRQSGFKRRIQKFERQVQEAKIEAEYWRNLALNSNQQQKPQEPQAPAPEPKLKDFNSVEEFIAARDTWLIEKVLPEKVQLLTQQQVKQTTEQQTQQQLVQSYTARVEEAKKELPDYLDVVQDLPDLPVDVQEFLLGSDVGPKLTYALAKDEALANRIVALPPLRRAAELGKLELQVSKPPASKKVTSAPAVAPKVTATAGAPVVTSTAEARNFQEYKALRLKQLAERNKR
jgi:hypothetical protein